MKRLRLRLTPADEAYIRARWATETAQQIAAAIGKTPSAVSQRASVLHLRKNPGTLSAIRSACGAFGGRGNRRIEVDRGR